MKILNICLLALGFSSFASAQTVAELFISMPDEMLVQLESPWRKDLIDLYKASKPATLENTLHGKSTLKMMTDDYLLLQTTERSTLEMRRLPLINNTFVICVVTTVYAPAADSKVCFYTTAWQPLTSDELLKPVEPAWFLMDVASPDAATSLDIQLVKYSLSADNNNITAEYTTPDYLDEETKAKVKPLLKGIPRVFEWKSGRYE
jgi:hypothetical protein